MAKHRSMRQFTYSKRGTQWFLKGPRTTGLAIALATAILLITAIIAGCSSSQPTNKVMVFQSPNCPCCEVYKEYLREQGFQVETTYVANMSSIKNKYHIPQPMLSCHTAVIGDYFVEGHIPVEAIEKMLIEKPDIDGISLPQMPPGSPGMPGIQTGAFYIYALTDGGASEFMIIDKWAE